ncbi:MAG: DUF3800 domain-containing protein [Nitrospira sp.]|mgnify:CR=1 FL=1|nr:MAG: DUF3800 domain-containing protein [Nitrospira sp.]
MWYLYVDESGDLGFDFFAKNPSKHFTVCLLLVRGSEANRAILSAVKQTIRRKLPPKDTAELKGTRTSFEVKHYFYRLVQEIPFEVFALTLNKRRVYEGLQDRKDRLYNFIARQVLDRVPLGDATTRIDLTMDRCKNTHEITDFNDYIVRQVQGRIDPRIPLSIAHRSSHEQRGLQAVDLFSWGIFRSYEQRDNEWRDVYAEKVKYDEVYLK